MIVIVDYGMGNVGSILNMLRRVGAPAKVSGDPADLAAADRLILPGVGAFDEGMRQIEARGLLPVLDEQVVGRGTPVLGICLGMQLLFERSEEGRRPGLGWIAGEVVRFRFDPPRPDLRVPHMGWNTVAVHGAPALFDGLGAAPRFYFVHSYHAVCAVADDVLATAHHGHDFAAAVRHGGIAGTQFHPEKSHRFGMQLLKNFAHQERAGDVECSRPA